MPDIIVRKALMRYHRCAMTFLFALILLLSTLSGKVGAVTLGTRYPGLISGILKFAVLAPMNEDTVLESESVTLKKSEIEGIVHRQEAKLRAQLEKNLLFVLESEATRRILLNEAQKAGIITGKGNDEGAIQALFERRTEKITVSEAEVQDFYRANKEMMGNAPLEQVKDSVRQYLLQEKKDQAIDRYIEGLTDSLRLRINDKWADAQSRLALDNSVEKARRSGMPTMVEFGATGCVPCDMMQPILQKLRKNYSNKLNVIFVHVGEEQILASRYGIRSIPVQAFYDTKGNEVFRHVGFYPEKEVIKQLKKAGF